MRDRATVAAHLRAAADAIERDETIPVPAVSLHFMAHAHGITDQLTAVTASAALFTCEWGLSIDHSELVDADFLNLHGDPAEGVRVDIGGHAGRLAELDATGTAWTPLPAVAGIVLGTDVAA